MIDLNQFNKTKFNNSPFAKRIEKPWGWEIHWVPEDKPYMGKILHINKGKRLSLQVHDQKQESWFLINGRAKVIWDNQNGELIETELENGKGYSCSLGQRHRSRGAPLPATVRHLLRAIGANGIGVEGRRYGVIRLASDRRRFCYSRHGNRNCAHCARIW